MDSVSCEHSSSEAQALLRSYLEGNKREKSFARLVAHYSTLIYSSALRRCGNRSLAEDITQNVLTILARKAPSLSKHPNLTAWVYQTTRLETSALMRTEKRRQRKHTNYSQDPLFDNNLKLSSEEQTAWKALLPHLDLSLDQLSERDRELILKRFFEKQKFKDIARDQKASEAACKMQLKRALERLGSLLQSHGTALPMSALGTGLLTSLAATAPSKAATTLAAHALSSSAALSTSATVTNTLLTMTNTQKVVTLSLLLITATSIPAVQMAKESSRLQEQLQTAKIHSQELSKKSTSQRDYQNSRISSRPAQSLLSSSRKTIDAHTLLKEITKAIDGSDIISFMQIFLPLSEMNLEELEQLLSDLQNTEEYPLVRPFACIEISRIIAKQSDSQSSEILERYLDQGRPPSELSALLSKWAEQNPHEALAWFQEKDKNNALSGKGTSDQSHHLFFSILDNLRETSPEQALQIYYQSDQKRRHSTLYVFTDPIIARYRDNHDLSELSEFLALEPEESIRSQILGYASRTVETLPEVLEILNLEKDSPQFSEHLIRSISKLELPLKTKATALEDQLPPADFQNSLSTLFNSRDHEQSEIITWIEQQPPGKIQDPTLSKYSLLLTRSGNSFQAAYEIAQNIGEEETRNSTIKTIAEAWSKKEPDQAKQQLPANILEQIHP